MCSERGGVIDAQQIRAKRETLGMTQEQFAGALGVTVASVQSWEHGRRTPNGRLLALALDALQDGRSTTARAALQAARALGYSKR